MLPAHEVISLFMTILALLHPVTRHQCYVQVLKHMYRQLVHHGLRCICILTKVDLVDEAIEDDVAAVQQSFAVHQLRQCISHATGIPMNQVRTVSHYPDGRSGCLSLHARSA